jgi:chorismate dehydratase
VIRLGTRGALRIGAVSYLNARPLVQGLEARTDRFNVRYDVPSLCATLLHEHRIDLGLIPSIEYLRCNDYRVVPDLAVVSDGHVASVAIFASCPIERVRSIALDTSSRTSVALTRILCDRRFGIRPRFEPYGPDLEAMMGRADAALLIGDPALFAEHARLGLEKIDLGAEWKAFTGLPFVYAFWTGLPGRVTPVDVALLREARDEGVRRAEEIAAAFFPGDAERGEIGGRYLRENISFAMGERERAGLERFFELSAEVGVMPTAQPLRFY